MRNADKINPHANMECFPFQWSNFVSDITAARGTPHDNYTVELLAPVTKPDPFDALSNRLNEAAARSCQTTADTVTEI